MFYLAERLGDLAEVTQFVDDNELLKDRYIDLVLTPLSYAYSAAIIGDSFPSSN